MKSFLSKTNSYKVFGKTSSNGGNRMAVVEQPMNPQDSGIPVTVLVENSQRCDTKFRFFYPDSLEAPLCGHALLGAAQTIEKDHFYVETGAGAYEVKKQGQKTFVKLSAFSSIDLNFTEEPKASLFGLEKTDMDVKGIFSAGKAKLVIEVSSLEKLNALIFDVDALATWNEGKNFSGYILYTVEEGKIYARASNPLFNVPEDSACAVCCAALPLNILMDTHSFSVLMGSPSFDNELYIQHTNEGVWVGGNVFSN
ncbi:PhzF family phenazine biosynthesis protein [Vibrio sp. Of7-15]|uniref:PhzF family phenazine biosynthesis protein n=1 Tax=Vibrio sp. Of7-15 TaxID=2724879 RepID=UPI001EF20AAB|nr:PhzF family phenazine biosynthesis protein [Vibrio sp. Of7-15]MCG7496423.1 PhzF family phenazine biosynthesis protein [Vibrio sp. Of7-15]